MLGTECPPSYDGFQRPRGGHNGSSGRYATRRSAVESYPSKGTGISTSFTVGYAFSPDASTEWNSASKRESFDRVSSNATYYGCVHIGVPMPRPVSDAHSYVSRKVWHPIDSTVQSTAWHYASTLSEWIPATLTGHQLVETLSVDSFLHSTARKAAPHRDIPRPLLPQPLPTELHTNSRTRGSYHSSQRSPYPESAPRPSSSLLPSAGPPTPNTGHLPPSGNSTAKVSSPIQPAHGSTSKGRSMPIPGGSPGFPRE